MHRRDRHRGRRPDRRLALRRGPGATVASTHPVDGVRSRPTPRHSPAFVDHVDVVIAIHGYGREDRFWDLLLGGRNRSLAAHVGSHLRDGIDERFGIVDELHEIPKGLRGQHPDNPVNLPAQAGVQIELPPTSRWNREEAEWSDWQGTGRAPQVDQLIDVLSTAVESWAA